jgi:hypothetical protein
MRFHLARAMTRSHLVVHDQPSLPGLSLVMRAALKSKKRLLI